MMSDILGVFLFFLPAYAANLFAFFFGTQYILKIRKPTTRFDEILTFRADFGFHFIDGRAVLNEKKQLIMPILAGIIGGIVGFFVSSFVIGFFMGFGAIVGDFFFSFFKRLFGARDGQSIIIIDQLDFYVGASAFAVLITSVSQSYFLIGLVLTFLLHIGMNVLGYLCKFKKTVL